MKKRSLITALSIILLCTAFVSCSESEPKKEKETKEEVIQPKNVDPADYYGCWKYTGSQEWICIFEDGKFMIHAGMEELIPPTEYTATPDGLYIPKMEITLSYDEEGVLWTSDGLSLEPSELAAYDLYIERNIK